MGEGRSNLVWETRATYDRVAESYELRSGALDEFMVVALNGFRDDLPPAALVLDAGCGPGRDLRALRDRGLRAYGLDLSQGMLRAGGLAGVVQGDLRRLPVADAVLDGVWCMAAMLHIPRHDVPSVLAEFRRVLRVGGLLHLVVAEGDREGWEVCDYHQPDEPGRALLRRWFVYHREEPLTSLLTAAGFRVTGVDRHRYGRHWLDLRARASQ